MQKALNPHNSIREHVMHMYMYICLQNESQMNFFDSQAFHYIQNGDANSDKY